MNLPNKISLFRMVLIPIIVIVWIFPYTQFGIQLPVYYIGSVSLSMRNILTCIIFAVASISDFLDGWLARSTNQVTTFGKFIDPIADKCLTTTLFILFASSALIPAVPVIVMVARDTMVDAVRSMAANKNRVMAAGVLGKIKTASQMICIILILLNNLPFELAGLPVADIMLWFSMLISVVSGFDYFLKAKDVIMETK